MMPLPKQVADELRAFLVDNLSGNVTLNIQKGLILGLKVERIVSLKP